jgi:hypothetical protein
MFTYFCILKMATSSATASSSSSATLIVRAFWQGQVCELEYEIGAGIEILTFQIISAHNICLDSPGDATDAEVKLELLDSFGIPVETEEALIGKV